MDRFQGITELNIHSSCRSCLENIDEMHHNIFAIPDLGKKFSVCTSLPIEPGDGYPTSVCQPCYTKIDDFYNFQQMCISARKRFEEYINSKEKPFKSKLGVDSYKLSTDFVQFMEPKGEKEGNALSNFDCSDFLQEELTIVNSQDDSLSEDNGEESDDDQPFAKYRVLNKDHISDKDSILIENKNNTQQIKTGDNLSLSKNKLECEIQDYIDSEKKPCAFELAIDTNNLPTDLMMLDKELKKEAEESNLPHDEYLDATELLNEESQEESDDNQPIIKCHKLSKKRQQTKTAPKIFKHAGLNSFPCDLCEKSYTRQGSLKLHIQTQHDGMSMKKFRCSETGRNRIKCSKLNLVKHIKDVHPKGTKVRQPFTCKVCGKVLTTLATLRDHRLLHRGQQSLNECPQCHKKCITKNKLKEHMNKHAGIRNYIYPHYGARKSTRTELKMHINYHTKEKTYPCQVCGSVFNNIASFRRHKRIVHEGIKEYPCSYCNKSFGASYTRKLHEMIHTGEKPYECNICQRKFIQPTALKRHTKTHWEVEPRQING